MPVAKRQTFDKLSEKERRIVGDPEDYDWENAIVDQARQRQGQSVQFSLRIERAEVAALQALAAGRGTTFSETVREAIRRYLASGGAPALTNIQVSVGSSAILRTEGRPSQLQPNRADPETPSQPEFRTGESVVGGATSSGI